MARDVISPGSFTHIQSQNDFSHICCGYWQLVVIWRWSRLNSWVFVEEIKVSIKCVQHGLTKWCRSSCFCILCCLDHLQHIFRVVGVEVPLQSLLMLLLFLFDNTFQFCSVVLHASLSPCSLFWLWKELDLSICSGLLVGEWSYRLFEITTSSTKWFWSFDHFGG